jgi:hypothetical protein
MAAADWIALAAKTATSNPKQICDRIIAQIGTRARSPELAAAVFGHRVACNVIATCWPETATSQFELAVFDGNTLRYSAFAYAARSPWTMHTTVTDETAVFTCHTIGKSTTFVVRIPLSSLRASADLNDLYSYFNPKAALALATFLTIFACVDEEGDHTVSF